MNNTYKIRVTPGKYPDQYRVQLLQQKSFRLLWWTFCYWEQINYAQGGAYLTGVLVHRWMTKYNLSEDCLEDLTIN